LCHGSPPGRHYPVLSIGLGKGRREGGFPEHPWNPRRQWNTRRRRWWMSEPRSCRCPSDSIAARKGYPPKSSKAMFSGSTPS
jgi:hypothetical protein